MIKENAEEIGNKVSELVSMGAMEIKVNGFKGYISAKFHAF